MADEVMMSYPWDSVVELDEHGDPQYDRAVGAEFLRLFYKKDRGDGVVLMGDSSALLVKAKATPSMKIDVLPGYCFIQGYYGIATDTQELTIETAHPTYDRIDNIVLRMDSNFEKRNIEVYIVKGTAAANPKAPALTRTDSQWEICLAQITVKASATTIQQQYILDTRLNESLCGQSVPLQPIDTDQFYLQMQDQVTRNIDLIKRALDETEAGYLENLIQQLQSRVQPVNLGGTGATTVAGARNALGLGNTSGALPIANGGTGGTSQSTAINNLGLKGSETKTLVWTNSSPTSQFATQTLSLSLSSYKGIEVEYANLDSTETSNKHRVFGRALKDGNPWIVSFVIQANSGNRDIFGVERTISSVTNTSCKFGVGMKLAVGAWSQNDYCLIPQRIWGIKEVS